MNIQAIVAAIVAPFFAYPLNISWYPSSDSQAEVMICSHGYGGSADDARHLVDYVDSPHHLLSFDFPDARLRSKAYDPCKTSFGSIRELLPLLAIIKACVVDAKLPAIHLYGFSAGGGAVINALAVLNTNRYDNELRVIGITEFHKQSMLQAIQRGTIILDCPLKSVEEIISLRGPGEELKTLAERYAFNDLRPIDAVKKLTGLSLSILLYIQKPDEVLSNRDDQKLYDDLREAVDEGSTIVRVQVDDGGHAAYHPNLWQTFEQLRK